MRNLVLAALACLALAGCGNSTVDSTMVGQIKKVARVTPILCPNRTDLDVSLGVIRGGVGSMSTQDVWLTVVNPDALATLKAAADSGAPVKLTYNTARIAVCALHEQVTSAEAAR